MKVVKLAVSLKDLYFVNEHVKIRVRFVLKTQEWRLNNVNSFKNSFTGNKGINKGNLNLLQEDFSAFRSMREIIA
jgi:hypothetical protein